MTEIALAAFALLAGFIGPGCVKATPAQMAETRTSLQALADWLGYRWESGQRLVYTFEATISSQSLKGELEFVVDVIETGGVNQLATFRVRDGEALYLRILRDRNGKVLSLRLAGDPPSRVVSLVTTLLAETQIVLGPAGLLTGRQWSTREKVGRREIRPRYEIATMDPSVEVRKYFASPQAAANAQATIDTRQGWLISVQTTTVTAGSTFTGRLSLTRQDVLSGAALSTYRSRFDALKFAPVGVRRGIAEE